MLNHIGIIAGGGDLPRKVIQHCIDHNISFYIVCLKGFASSELKNLGPHISIRLGSVGAGIKALRNFGAQNVIMAGSVKRPPLHNLLPDAKGLLLLKKIMHMKKNSLGDDKILSIIESFLADEGFDLISCQDLLSDSLFTQKTGALGNIKPDEDDLSDIAYGYKAALAIGTLDIGQSAIVQQGVILGLEGIEGTDELIKRCQLLKKEGPAPILVKACKPHQDMRFDIPTIGPQTIENLKTAQFKGLALESGRTFILDQEKTIQLADQYQIFIYSLSYEPHDT